MHRPKAIFREHSYERSFRNPPWSTWKLHCFPASAIQTQNRKKKDCDFKSIFHYLEYKDILDRNPFNKIRIRFREPVILPKTIPLHTVEIFLATIYRQLNNAPNEYQKRNALRDAAVVELLFSTGMRISELCSLRNDSVNLSEGTVLIYGKGSKERRIHIGNDTVIRILMEYKIILSAN